MRVGPQNKMLSWREHNHIAFSGGPCRYVQETQRNQRNTFYTHMYFFRCPASLMETHPCFLMCPGSKMETHTRFHVILLFFGGNTRAFPICKGNTVKVSLKKGIAIVEVGTHFIHIACLHATGALNVDTHMRVLYFWRCYVRKHMRVGSTPFPGWANFCFCAAAFSAAAMSLRKKTPVEH